MVVRFRECPSMCCQWGEGAKGEGGSPTMLPWSAKCPTTGAWARHRQETRTTKTRRKRRVSWQRGYSVQAPLAPGQEEEEAPPAVSARQGEQWFDTGSPEGAQKYQRTTVSCQHLLPQLLSKFSMSLINCDALAMYPSVKSHG